MERHKICSFFGHRKIEITAELKQKVSNEIENLIVNHNVTAFLFGSRSKSYQPKSGTAIAYAYAKRKKKILINTFEK